MNYVKVPNIPERKVRLALVDGRISPSLEAGFKDRGIQLIKTEAHSDFTRPFPFIPMPFFIIWGKKIVYAPGVPRKFFANFPNGIFASERGSRAWPEISGKCLL